MAWIASVVGAGASLYSSSQASKGQANSLNSQEGLTSADLEFREKTYEDQKDFAKPIADELQAQALQPGPLDYGPARDQINDQFASAGRTMETQMAQRGLTGSEVDAGATRAMILKKAGALTTAYNQGIINKRGLALTLLGHDQRMQAAGMLGQGYQNSANLAGQQAGMYGAAAQAGYGAAASAIGNGLYLYGTNRQPSPPPINYGVEDQSARNQEQQTGVITGSGWGA